MAQSAEAQRGGPGSENWRGGWRGVRTSPHRKYPSCPDAWPLCFLQPLRDPPDMGFCPPLPSSECRVGAGEFGASRQDGCVRSSVDGGVGGRGPTATSVGWGDGAAPHGLGTGPRTEQAFPADCREVAGSCWYHRPFREGDKQGRGRLALAVCLGQAFGPQGLLPPPPPRRRLGPVSRGARLQRRGPSHIRVTRVHVWAVSKTSPGEATCRLRREVPAREEVRKPLSRPAAP